MLVEALAWILAANRTLVEWVDSLEKVPSRLSPEIEQRQWRRDNSWFNWFIMFLLLLIMVFALCECLRIGYRLCLRCFSCIGSLLRGPHEGVKQKKTA